MRLIQRNRRIHEEKSEVLAKLDTGAIAMPIAKTAARSRLLEIAADREAQRKQAEAAETKSELDQFDARLAKMPVDEQAGYLQRSYSLLSTFSVLFHFRVIGSFTSVCRDVEGYILRSLAGDSAALELDGPVGDPSLLQLHPEANEQHIMRVRRTLEEEAAAREEREKRRRKVRLHVLYFTVPAHIGALHVNAQVCERLLCFCFVQVITEQMRAQLEQADASKEEQLMRRLLRQSQAERRMAVQLLQVRREKRTIRENRAFREAQYAERRAKDFELALDRESVCTPALLYTRTVFTSSLLRCWLSSLSVVVGPSHSSNRTELN